MTKEDFYEDDEPVAPLVKAYEAGPHVVVNGPEQNSKTMAKRCKLCRSRFCDELCSHIRWSSKLHGECVFCDDFIYADAEFTTTPEGLYHLECHAVFQAWQIAKNTPLL